MLRRWGLVFLLLLVPAVARAQDAPEQLLPAGTQVYLRWDGIDAHKAAYDKVALGKMLQGDTGKFVASVFSQFQDLLGSAVVQELLQGVPPEKLQKVQADALEAPKLVPLLGKHGLILAAEVRGLEPPDAQVTIILPDAGDSAGPLLAAIRLAAALSKQEIKESKVAGRTVYQLAGAPITIAWWVEGKHLLLTGGLHSPDILIKRLDGKEPRLTENPLFQRVRDFKDFETGARAFVDVAALVKVAGSRKDENLAKLLSDLGLDAIKSLVLYSGFDGAAERDVLELDTSGPRKGALRLLAAKPFKLGDLPPVPPDAASWTMTNFDFKVAYDEGVKAAENVVRIASPDDLPKLKEALKQVDDLLGIKLREDLLESLGDQLVQYTSAAEGPMFFGQTYLIKVKDPKKLQETLDQAVKGVSKVAGVDVTTKKRPFHGVDLYEVHVRQQGFIFVPTYTIHKGWLAVSYYPQAVQGYILRANGELPAWKPEESTREALGKLPKEFVSISVSDPRPSVKQVLSLAPLVGGAVNSFAPESHFDVGAVPNGHEATRYLFPNVSVASMDKDVLRLETRASLALPLDLSNADTLIGAEFLTVFAIRFAAIK
jgi:hypothetical protein